MACLMSIVDRISMDVLHRYRDDFRFCDNIIVLEKVIKTSRQV